MWVLAPFGDGTASNEAKRTRPGFWSTVWSAGIRVTEGRAVTERQVTTLQGQPGELIGQLEALMAQDSQGDAERAVQKKKVGQMMAPGCVFAFLTIGALFVFPWAAIATVPVAIVFFVM